MARGKGQAPGGSTDILARKLAHKLTEALGVSVFVDNIPGTNGLLSLQAMARAPGDGYTLLLTY